MVTFLDKEDLQALESLSLEWLEKLTEQYKRARLDCQVERMEKLVQLKRTSLEKNGKTA